MNVYELSEDTDKLIMFYNRSFPDNKLGTLDLHEDLTEEALVKRLTRAMTEHEPILNGDKEIYRNVIKDIDAGLFW